LVVRPDEELPHTFIHDDSLCLYYNEFSPARNLFADTLVPWASEWLLHYELWLATGAWHGGESSIAARAKNSRARASTR
jgi:hypothetical protein